MWPRTQGRYNSQTIQLPLAGCYQRLPTHICGGKEFLAQIQYPIHVIQVIVGMQRKPQHAAAYRQLDLIVAEIFVESVVASLVGAVMVGTESAHGHDACKMR